MDPYKDGVPVDVAPVVVAMISCGHIHQKV
jgi:hypothetical protein